MNDITLINDAIKKHRELSEYYDAMGCKDDVLVQERYIVWLSELRDYKEKEKANDECGKAEMLGEYDSGYSDGFTDGNKMCEIFNPIQHKTEPVKHGRWLETNDDTMKRCSECDVIHLIAQYPHGNANYCPNCGAKMDGGEKNG